MEIVLQIAVVLMIGLIAYWWANQGFFSSLLHFVAVVVAGALTLAFWEPLVYEVLLRGTWFDSYAWGVGFVGLFLIGLVVFRLVFDRLAPKNVDVPRWADLAFGGALGAGSGVITVGMLLIGLGFLQSSTELLGYRGWVRTGRTIEREASMWVPAHRWTADFYEFLSDGALYPTFAGDSLAKVNPDLDRLALSLIRDSYDDGRGRITLPPDSIEIVDVYPANDRIVVGFRAERAAFDHARQFTLSASQARLLAYQGGTDGGQVSVAHPTAWVQAVQVDGEEGGVQAWRRYLFDETSHYATSVPGQNAATIFLEFPVGRGEGSIEPGAVPLYLQLKGVRFRLPVSDRQYTAPELLGMVTTGFNTTPETVPVNPEAPLAAGNDIRVTDDVRPLSLDANRLLGLEADPQNYLLRGDQVVPRGQATSRENRIRGFAATEGTEIVQVTVSRGGSIDVYKLRNTVGDEAPPVLVDAQGRQYLPIGYIHVRPDDVHVKLTPSQPIQAIADLPELPTSGTHELRLIYEITRGVNLVAFNLGDTTVARTNLVVD